MAKFAYITNGMASTLNSGFELSRRLAERGHDVVFVGAESLRERVQEHGFEFCGLSERERIQQEFSLELKSIGKIRSWRQLRKALRLAREYRKRSLDCREIEQLVREDIKPQMLIIDIEMHVAVLSCLNLGIPIALPIVWYSIFRCPNLPPMHTLLGPPSPPNNPVQRWQIRFGWCWLLTKRWCQQRLEWFGKKGIRKRLGPINTETNRRSDLIALAKNRGIDWRSQTDWTQWLSPQTYPDLTVLCLNTEELEFPHTPPHNIRYVGPMVQRDRPESRVTGKQNAEWQAFRDSSIQKDRRLVYCSLGTYWSTDRAFLKKVIATFERRQEWALVIGLGGKLGRQELGSLPENVLAMDYAPQMEVLAHCSAAITHGGITTINECITRGVPMLVFSTGHVDQNGCAARVQHFQLGISADLAQSSSQEIDQLLDQILNSHKMLTNVLESQQVFQKYASERVAERVLEGMLVGDQGDRSW